MTSERWCINPFRKTRRQVCSKTISTKKIFYKKKTLFVHYSFNYFLKFLKNRILLCEEKNNSFVYDNYYYHSRLEIQWIYFVMWTFPTVCSLIILFHSFYIMSLSNVYLSSLFISLSLPLTSAICATSALIFQCKNNNIKLLCVRFVLFYFFFLHLRTFFYSL